MSEATITNTCLCSPEKNKLPQKAIKECNAHIRMLIKGYDHIFLLGATAVKAVFNGELQYSQLKGSCIERDGKVFYILTHPAAMLHKPDIRESVEYQYKTLYNAWLTGEGSGQLKELQPKFSDYPDGFFVRTPEDVSIIDAEWDSQGNVLIGVCTSDGVWQHTRMYADPGFPPRAGMLLEGGKNGNVKG